MKILKIYFKFPTKWGIKEIRGDQKLARECYAASLKSAAKECFVTTISEERSRRYIEPAMFQKCLPEKYNDPGMFTVPIKIGHFRISKALLDLGDTDFFLK